MQSGARGMGRTVRAEDLCSGGAEAGLRRGTGGVPVGTPFSGGGQIAGDIDMCSAVAAWRQGLLGEAQLQQPTLDSAQPPREARADDYDMPFLTHNGHENIIRIMYNLQTWKVT
ncbi:MAG: hypothetical protein B7X09_00155 [Acidiphilium sp. 21-66-27]|uniref:Uncharacterized protein n=1 Tax=Acidiphilium cryptum (strain JF-5) TaxID=349163 RepID=A5FT33_ACICJ|nr:hypothetical protein Acry_3138 [Acidiphilium cryptum JF-5]OYV54733.1 MAG: hypothetical protein B7Z76_13335 [Acidiphilium sp. 20-67-58]OYV67815.1 MAG: hypothetical protein B7X09_00155 [Acidiphilium sp. 21-66-27]